MRRSFFLMLAVLAFWGCEAVMPQQVADCPTVPVAAKELTASQCINELRGQRPLIVQELRRCNSSLLAQQEKSPVRHTPSSGSDQSAQSIDCPVIFGEPAAMVPSACISMLRGQMRMVNPELENCKSSLLRVASQKK